MPKYKIITEQQFNNGYGLGFRRYICRAVDCRVLSYVFWNDINNMTFSFDCQVCGHEAAYKSGKLRPIPLNGVKDVGYYDRALGQYIRSHKHKEQVMSNMGVRPISDDEITTNISDQMSDAIEHEKTIQTFSRTMRDTNSFAAAARSISEE